MFRDCFGGIGRHARDDDPQRLSRFKIDMIETGASQGNQSRPLAVKRGEYVSIEAVVDEGADRTRSRRPRHRLQIGRASCRERVCQYVYISVVAVPLQKKSKK